MLEQDVRTWRELFVVSFMRGAPRDLVEWAMPRLMHAMREVRLRPGDLAYRLGEPSRHFYFVVSGRVRLERDDAPPWEFGERSIIGALDATMDRPRSRDAVADTELVLLELPSEAWLEVLEDSIDMSIRAIEVVARGVHDLLLGAVARGLVRDSSPPRPREEAPLPVALNLVDRILLLRRVTCLGRAGVQTLASLASVADEVVVEPGDALFATGDADGAIFVVARGEIETERTEPSIVTRYGRGAMVAGPAALVDRDAYAARATQRTLVLRFSREDWFDVMEEHFDLVRSTMISLAEEREGLMNLLGAVDAKRVARPERPTSSDEASP